MSLVPSRRLLPRHLLGTLCAAISIAGVTGCGKGTGSSAGGSAGPAAESLSVTPVTDTMLQGPEAGANWLSYGGTVRGHHYSTLDQITRDNVASLAPAWIYQTGIASSFETTPIVVDGVMYITTPERNQIIALNAATGERRWIFDPDVGKTTLCCGPNNRGVAVYHDKVYEGTLDGRLVAVDAATGHEAWEVQVADPNEGYSITAAPLAVDGKVITGLGGGEYGIRGRITAYDAETGKELWRFNTVPSPSEAPNGWWGDWKTTTPFGLDLHRDIAAEKADSAKWPDAWQRGGAASWMTPTYDPDSHMLYIAVGNPSPDLDGTMRPGDNLYSQSIVAINADDGSYKWHFQYIPHGVWDLDATSPPLVFTLDGRKVVAHAGKIGFLYLLDAATGKPILRSENFVPMDSLFTPPTAAGIHMLPGANGGSEWSPISYSPTTGLIYVMGLHQPMTYSTHPEDFPGGQLWLGSAFTGIPKAAQWGTFAAIDPATGGIRWIRRVSRPMEGGSVATAGNLVFVGEGNGNFDAFDAETGDLRWQFNTGAGVNAAPMAYSVGGVEYVAVAAGGIFQLDTPRGDNLIAFALPGKRPATSAGYPEPDFTRTPALHYDSVQTGAASTPSMIVTGALKQSVQEGGNGGSVGETGGTSNADNAPMTQDAKARTVTFRIRSATTAANHGWNFNGYAKGDMRLVVPKGYRVTVEFTNLDPSLPHSVGVITGSPSALPASGDAATLAFPGAAVGQFTDGIGPNGTGRFAFTADKAGQYILFCGVPGHGQGGMWDFFRVSATADTASIVTPGGSP